MARILIIDDDPQICELLRFQFSDMGHDPAACRTLNEGLAALAQGQFDLVFLDVNLPDGSGLDAIPLIMDNRFPPEIIIMTGATDPEGAELAMKLKVWDYIQKGESIKPFRFSVSRALEYRNQKKAQSSERKIDPGRIVGESRLMQACLEFVSKASGNEIPVLISGETGTGKELFARAIHRNSSRKTRDFVVVDCASLPDHLVESILFGHVRGAFTSADSDKIGLIKLADKGTLFLDEVGELSLNIQKKFLRALQEKKIRPVGGKEEISCDFRLISATHRDLPAMTAKGQFREDLYYRISSTRLEVPPLRHRKTDILLLAETHMKRKAAIVGGFGHDLSEEFIMELESYNWPGNVRELFNAMDHACNDAVQEGTLFPTHLPDQIRATNIKRRIKALGPKATQVQMSEPGAPVREMSLKAYVERAKAKYLEDLMVQTQGDMKKACRWSGLSTGHLYSLLKKYDIKNF